MAANNPATQRSTPDAVAAEAQSRERSPPGARAAGADQPPVARPAGLGTRFLLGQNLDRSQQPPLRRQPGDPIYRPLRIYAIDPSVSRLEGSIATVNVPYEKLEPGPAGRLFEVDDCDAALGLRYRSVDLDDPALLMSSGLAPTPSDPRFHQQMVYAVCSTVYSTFRAALGRQLAWGFRKSRADDRLVLRPHAFVGANAWYDQELGEIAFGYFKAPEQPAVDRSLPGGYIFACLSHDVIAHELSHAILHSLRARYTVPTGSDVLAFHEAFADLVAIFQRFSYQEHVKVAIARSRGALDKATLLSEVAGQFGRAATARRTALRSAVESEPPPRYDARLEPHDLGALLVAAVFEAFATVYRRKTARYVRVATNGSAILPPGDLPADLLGILAGRASRLASQFLSVLIRAVDYCPAADLSLGEYLRAVITADFDLVPNDTWGYREAFIDAFLRRNIYPRGVSSLSEDALLWRPTRRPFDPIELLSFAHLQFRGDPGTAAGPDELRRQGTVLGEFVSRPENLAEFGLVAPGDPELEGDEVDLPVVESVRSARRVGPDGQVVFDLVGAITQRRQVASKAGHPGFELFGGATVILGPEGEIRYAISKRVTAPDRAQRRREFIDSEVGRRFWTTEAGHHVIRGPIFRMLHDPESGCA